MTKPKRTISAEQLRHHLNYDCETGLFTRNLPHHGGKVGDVAGTVKDGYINIYVCGTHIKAHRLAWIYVYGQDVEKFIDHINGNKSDNRICNLRAADVTENSCNKGLQSNNKTGQKGVFFDKARNKYRAEAEWRGVKKYLGRFSEFTDAQKAYTNFAMQMHGDFYKPT